jgi:hypothetical protein
MLENVHNWMGTQVVDAILNDVRTQALFLSQGALTLSLLIGLIINYIQIGKLKREIAELKRR